MKNYDIHTTIYEDRNECLVKCNDPYVCEKIKVLVESKGASLVGKPYRKKFTFHVNGNTSIDDYLSEIMDAIPDIINKARAYNYMLGKMHFWLFWAVLWGVFDFLFEVRNLYLGEFSKAMLFGFCGVVVVLSSLSNYWKHKKVLNGLKSEGYV